MEHEFLTYQLLTIIAGALSLFLCLYALIKIKDAPGVKFYSLMTFLSAVFTYAYAFELASNQLREMRFWLSIEYLAMPFIPVMVLFMCLEYVGQKLKGWMYVILISIPITTIFIHNEPS